MLDRQICRVVLGSIFFMLISVGFILSKIGQYILICSLVLYEKRPDKSYTGLKSEYKDRSNVGNGNELFTSYPLY